MRRVILAICATAAALVLLLTFKSHTQSPVPGSAQAGAIGTPTTGSSTATSPAVGSAASSAPAASGGTAKTVTGAAWPTVYGPVQVRLTVTGGKITAVTAVEYPTGTPRDVQINQFAIPALNSETLKAGSAQIDTVSGATYTSQGYIGSLQNALDRVKS